MSEPLRILYVLNAMGGGASIGIYELLHKMPRDHYIPYAITPPGSEQQFQRVNSLFADVKITPLDWWNIPDRRSAAARGAIFRSLAQWCDARRQYRADRAHDCGLEDRPRAYGHLTDAGGRARGAKARHSAHLAHQGDDWVKELGSISDVRCEIGRLHAVAFHPNRRDVGLHRSGVCRKQLHQSPRHPGRDRFHQYQTGSSRNLREHPRRRRRSTADRNGRQYDQHVETPRGFYPHGGAVGGKTHDRPVHHRRSKAIAEGALALRPQPPLLRKP